MTADRLALLLRPQRWRWAGPQPRPSLQGGPQGPAWRHPMATAFVNSPVYAEARQALTS